MADAQERIGQSIGDYRLLRLLGEGRFGTVYLAEHLHDRTLAAVKLLHLPLTGSNALHAFLNEARTIRLRHPHIVPILDFGLSHLDDLPYLVMAYVDSGSLRDHCSIGSKLPHVTIGTYVQQLASALQYAHDCHIIHCDVKPENMLVRSDGTIQLSDFGIARISEHANQSSLHKVAGTPAYAASEQSEGQPCPASDQYALAIVVYEWLSGKLPFQGAPLALMLHHHMDKPPSLQSICPEVSPEVEQVIFKALAKAPKDRYPTITYFAEALHTALEWNDEPTQVFSKAKLLEVLGREPSELFTSEEGGSDVGSYSFPQSVEGSSKSETPAEISLPPRLVLASRRDAATPDADELHNAPTLEGLLPVSMQDEATLSFPTGIAPAVDELHNAPTLEGLLPISTQDEATHSFPTGIAPTAAKTGEKLQPKAIQQKGEIPAFWLGKGRPRHSSTLAKVRLKKMIQHQPAVSHRQGVPLQRPQPLPTWMRLIGSFLIVVLIGGGFSVLLHLQLPTLSLSSTQNSGAAVTPISQASAHNQVPTSSPQHQTLTPISPAIPAGKLLYSTPSPFSACDKQGGHWTDTSDARVTCHADGSEMVNTSGHLAVANLDRLATNPSPWPSQNCIIQVQATINPNSRGAFGIGFQSDSGDNAQAYFAYVLNPPNDWAFNYYKTPGNLADTLISSRLLSSVSSKLTIDIRVEGIFYTFYINGVDTTGQAVTGSQYINKIVGLAVDANADITFANLAIYELP